MLAWVRNERVHYAADRLVDDWTVTVCVVCVSKICMPIEGWGLSTVSRAPQKPFKFGVVITACAWIRSNGGCGSSNMLTLLIRMHIWWLVIYMLFNVCVGCFFCMCVVFSSTAAGSTSSVCDVRAWLSTQDECLFCVCTYIKVHTSLCTIEAAAAAAANSHDVWHMCGYDGVLWLRQRSAPVYGESESDRGVCVFFLCKNGLALQPVDVFRVCVCVPCVSDGFLKLPNVMNSFFLFMPAYLYLLYEYCWLLVYLFL